jgi:hypothetical protein|tara:strand:+ start:23 stop:268 length:246 start_codon:yes stop_codon:yes gene_type:complete
MSDERSSDSVCDCSCNDVCGDKGDTTVRILGSVDRSIDLYVSTPPHTKWIFVDDVESDVEKKVTKFPDGWTYVGQDTDEQC